jgi:hypothetical protein
MITTISYSNLTFSFLPANHFYYGIGLRKYDKSHIPFGKVSSFRLFNIEIHPFLPLILNSSPFYKQYFILKFSI